VGIHKGISGSPRRDADPVLQSPVMPKVDPPGPCSGDSTLARTRVRLARALRATESDFQCWSGMDGWCAAKALQPIRPPHPNWGLHEKASYATRFREKTGWGAARGRGAKR
jgi:hypothetical protein